MLSVGHLPVQVGVPYFGNLPVKVGYAGLQDFCEEWNIIHSMKTLLSNTINKEKNTFSY